MQGLPKLQRNYSFGAIIWGLLHPTEENILMLRHVSDIYNHTPVALINEKNSTITIPATNTSTETKSPTIVINITTVITTIIRNTTIPQVSLSGRTRMYTTWTCMPFIFFFTIISPYQPRTLSLLHKLPWQQISPKQLPTKHHTKTTNKKKKKKKMQFIHSSQAIPWLQPIMPALPPPKTPQPPKLLQQLAALTTNTTLEVSSGMTIQIFVRRPVSSSCTGHRCPSM